MKRFPQEFEGLLSPRGRRLLARPSGRRAFERFASVSGLIEPRVALAAAALLERALGEYLSPMEEPIPDWTIRAMQQNYAELLPKTVRVHTALMASRRSRVWQRAEEIGLLPMLTSGSFKRLAEVLSGYSLRNGWGTQVLCYRAGDYTGPHNDHHPEEPEARNGYVDLHLTFCNSAVAHQWLVYEKGGHLGHIESVATRGAVTCYRLPFWHYTTPLVAKRGGGARARRWVLLGTFLDQKAPQAQATLAK